MVSAAVQQASTEIANCLVAGYRNERGIHAETVIGAAAALAGEFALRSTASQLPDSGWVFSPEASELIFGDPGLCDMLRETALEAGAGEADMPKPVELSKRIAGSVGGSPYPPLSVPQHHYPHEWSPNACVKFRVEIERIAAAHQLTKLEVVVAIVMATQALIVQAKSALSPAIGATLAMEIMGGVSHMAPLKQPV
ncbi:hypothetical protein [Pelagibius sp. 7325]|uniref:hypothetical protein n=1 Tax=Pelagibius sp. 7325 TaxID=3131994 RepID=UPI0030EBDB16